MAPLTPALIAAALGAHGSPDQQAVGAVEVGHRVAVIITAKGGEAHGDSGRVIVRYVDYDPATHRSDVPEVSEGRASWGAAPTWTLRKDLGDAQMLEVKGGGTRQGTTCQWTALVELATDAPREVLVALTDHSSDGGKGDYQATIARDGKGLKLVYTGSIKRTFRLRRVGGRIVSDPSLPMAC